MSDVSHPAPRREGPCEEVPLREETLPIHDITALFRSWKWIDGGRGMG